MKWRGSRIERARGGDRWKRVGTLRRPKAHKAANRVKFSGRIRHKALKRGRYRFVVRARDAAGNTSKPRRARFRVVRR